MSENGSETEQITSSSSDKQSKNGDEQVQSMSVGELDPAILFVRERVKIRYSKEELLEISKNPASKAKPDFLDPNEVSASILDPEKWNLERKKSDTPETGSKGTDTGDNRRRSGDPRERIRKENDGIVLSPQRRSFNSGCFVPANKESLAGKSDAPSHIIGVREIASSTRRIGSGRILRDTWDSEKETGDPEFSAFNRGQPPRNSERDEKFGERGGLREDGKFGERRSFGRDIDGGKEKDNRRNTRYSEGRRRYSENKEDEPEWFSSGPMSQNDTIELRGFDEPEKLGKKKVRASHVKRAKDWSKKKETTPIAEDQEKDDEKEPKERSTPNQQEPDDSKDEDGSTHNNGDVSRKETDLKPGNLSQSGHSFDFDEFLTAATFPDMLDNGVGDEATSSASRFSRWFKKESPSKEAPSRGSSFQEDNHITKDLLKDLNESSSVPVTIRPPMDSDTYFAPISPAGNTPGDLNNLMGCRPVLDMGQSVDIMDMLTGSKPQHSESWNMKTQGPPLVGGKILSLDELEAKIRHNSDHSANVMPKPPQKPDEEMTAAFKKLLQQAGAHSGQQNEPMSKAASRMSLLEMLSHSQQQDEARLAAARAAASQQKQEILNALHAHMQPQQQMNNDRLLKLQAQRQQQKYMEMLSLGKMMSTDAVTATGHLRASPLLDMGPQQSRELLNRPEAQAILQGLKRGEITIQHLYQQLANPALQPRHREMLVTILKLHGNSSNYGPSPRVLSPVPLVPHHLYPPQQTGQMHQQQLRVSPLPPNAMHQRIPSPRELQVHTQNILQRALIKKKLEEQSENYRKKQEMQRGQSPNPSVGVGGTNSGSQQSGKSVPSPTPLAFTPTSVLRKMTADKDEGKENKAVTDNGLKPQGRALTGMRQQPQGTMNNQQWNQASFSIKQAGRPIVKANNYQWQTSDQFFAQLAAQQQPLPQQRTYQAVPTAAHRKPIIGQQYPAQVSGSQYGPSQSQYSHPNPQSSFSQPTPQQLRAQHQHRPSNNSTTQQQQSAASAPNQTQTSQAGTAPQKSQNSLQPSGFPQGPNQQQQGTAAWQQFFNSTAQQQNSRPIGTPSRPGQHSPTTTDQLTRWFSPDLLERARGGELPSTANLARLEEIERQAAPPVHN